MKVKRKIFLFGALVVLGAAFLFYAAVAPAVVNEDKVAAAFAEDVEAALGLKLRHGGASFGLLPRPAVTLRRVVLFNPKGKDILRADYVKVGLSYVGFLTLRPAVATVECHRPRADFAAGDVSFGVSGRAKPPPFRGTVIVTDGFARWAGESRTVLLDAVNGRLRCRAAWGSELDVRGRLDVAKVIVGSTGARTGEENAPAATAVGMEGRILYRVQPDGWNFTLDGCSLLLGKARLAVAGDVKSVGSERELDITLKGKGVPLAQCAPALLPRLADAELGGEVDVDLAFKGPWREGSWPSVRGTLSLAKGEILPDEGEGVSALQGRVRFLGSEYVLEEVKFQSRRGGFRGHGRVTARDRWPFEFTADGECPLEVFALVFGLPEGYALAGPADWNLDVTGELSNPSALTLDGNIKLESCRLRLKPFASPFYDLSGTINCQSYKLTAGKIRGRFAGGEFEIGGTWQGFETPQVEFAAVADNLDIDGALMLGEKKRRRTEEVNAPPGLPGTDINVKGAIRLKRSTLLRVKVNELDSEFEYAGGILNFKKLDFGAYDGKVHSLATVYLTGKPRYTFSVTVRGVRLGVFLAENKWLENVVTGEFGADVVFSAEGTSFDDVKRTFGGKGSLELKAGRVAGLKLLTELAKWSRIDLYEPLQVKRLWATADAAAGVIRTTDLTVENADMTITAAGEVDLEKRLNFVVKTVFEKRATERLAREGKALALVRDEDGKGHFNFILTGDADRPAFQLDAASMLGAVGAPPAPPEPAALEDIF